MNNSKDYTIHNYNPGTDAFTNVSTNLFINIYVTIKLFHTI